MKTSLQPSAPSAPDDSPGLTVAVTAGFAVSMLIVGAFFMSLSPLLPAVAATLDPAAAALGRPGALYAAALAVAALASAPLQDVVPRRAVILAGAAAHAGGAVLAAAAPSWTAFSFAFGLCGVGAGVLQPAVYALVADLTAADRRTRTIGRVNIGWSAATLAGVPALAFAASQAGWRMALVSAAGAWAIGLVLMRPALTRTPRRAVAAPVPRGRLLLREGAISFFACAVLVFIGFYGVYSFLGIVLQESAGASGARTGAFVAVYGAGFLTALLNARVVDRLGPAAALRGALVGIAALAPALVAVADSAAPFAAAMFAWGVLQSTVFMSLVSIAGRFPENVRGAVLAVNVSAVMAGAAIGTFAMGHVVAAAGAQWIGVPSAAATLLAAAVACTAPAFRNRTERGGSKGADAHAS